jgi:hypothetical protein
VSLDLRNVKVFEPGDAGEVEPVAVA